MVTEPDEDTINVQDLQANIDLSMSFASSLAASWIKIRPPSNNARRIEMEKEILEIAKRPSRLGVGASASQLTQQTTREAARLRGQLVGKKRGREDGDDMKHVSKAVEEDGEESRAGAIKKRVKVDPFDIPSKKKKKKQAASETAPTPSSSSSKDNGSSLLANSGKSKSKETPKPPIPTPFEPNWNKSEAPSLPGTQKSLPAKINPEEVNSNKLEGESSRPGTSKPTDERSNAAYLALVSSLSPSSKVEALKTPLLVLSDHSDSDDNTPQDAGSSSGSKKKRKRKKKKKKHVTDGQNGNNDPQPPST